MSANPVSGASDCTDQGVDLTNTPKLLITVDVNKTPFIVDPQLMAGTTFFAVHGDPISQEERHRHAQLLNTEELRREQTTLADIHIQDKFYDNPVAFRIFIEGLNSGNIQKIKTRSNYEDFLNLCLLVYHYDAYGLQNQLMDAFRTYHAMKTVQIADLVWLTSRIGINRMKVPLTLYLIEQIAYDICDQTYEDYERNNQRRALDLFLDEWRF